MSNRREFLKAASILGISSLSSVRAKSEAEEPAQAKTLNDSRGLMRAVLETEANDIVLENAEVKLIISASGWARSLVHRPTGQECLSPSPEDSLFTLTQDRPYDNELQLALPARVTSFPATQIKKRGDHLIVQFHAVGYEADIQLSIPDSYIAFSLKSLTYNGYTPERPKMPTQIDGAVFFQLPVLNRKNHGEQLNVIWDDAVAVNLLATNLATKIDAQLRRGYHLFQAGSVRDVRLLDAGAALIVTSPAHLLDRIAKVEEDFMLPRGVESRRRPEYKYSYYQAISLTPADVDRHINYAKMGGFRMMNIYCMAFAKTVGTFPWRSEYPRGMADLKDVVAKVKAAGIIPGLHILYTMATSSDPMVAPVPDRRLNLIQGFTLSESIGKLATTIPVDENPHQCPTSFNEQGLDRHGRLLKVQSEIISYESYTTEPPFQFEGCKRGALGTAAQAYEEGTRLGLLDTYGDTPPDWLFMRFAQNSSLPDEVADRIQKHYDEAGFQFLYFDGAEQVPAPFWYTVAQAQQRILAPLKTKPLFAEASCKSHFSWHIATRGNAFDIATPEQVKAAIRAFPAEEMQRVSKDFTRINFGWLGYWPPSEKTIGTQPDMLEYATSRAAAWDCPVSLSASTSDHLKSLDKHPRTPDNMEVFRRWEEVRTQNWLTSAQKHELRNLEQEHTLLIDEGGRFELVPWEELKGLRASDRELRAFLFKRNDNFWVAYWHPSGQSTLQISIGAKHIRLLREPGGIVQFNGDDHAVRLPLGERHYIEFLNAGRSEVISALRAAKVIFD
jgi:hypothetical protein